MTKDIKTVADLISVLSALPADAIVAVYSTDSGHIFKPDPYIATDGKHKGIVIL